LCQNSSEEVQDVRDGADQHDGCPGDAVHDLWHRLGAAAEPAYTITLEHEVVRHTTHFYRVAPLSVTTDRWFALTLPPIVANRHYLVTAHVACLYPGRKDFFIVGPVRRSEKAFENLRNKSDVKALIYPNGRDWA